MTTQMATQSQSTLKYDSALRLQSTTNQIYDLHAMATNVQEKIVKLPLSLISKTSLLNGLYPRVCYFTRYYTQVCDDSKLQVRHVRVSAMTINYNITALKCRTSI